jgi:SAM-dependent methyltransferase
MKNTTPKLAFLPPTKREYNISQATRAAFSLCKKYKITKIYDYGCGYGNDIQFLRSKYLVSYGHDPFFYYVKEPNYKKLQKADIIILSYVLNVLPLVQRQDVLRDIVKNTKEKSLLIVTVPSERLFKAMCSKNSYKKPYSDGFLSPRNFFNRSFTKEQLSTLLESFSFKVEIFLKQDWNKNGVTAICRKN